MEYSPFSVSPPPGNVSLFPARDPGSLAGIIARIEEAVDEETAALGTDLCFDIQASNARKSRCLYELTRATKGLRAEDVGSEQRDGFKRLREKLARNERAVRAHLDAVSEVAALLQSAVAQAQSDGTYDSAEFGRPG